MVNASLLVLVMAHTLSRPSRQRAGPDRGSGEGADMGRQSGQGDLERYALVQSRLETRIAADVD